MFDTRLMRAKAGKILFINAAYPKMTNNLHLAEGFMTRDTQRSGTVTVTSQELHYFRAAVRECRECTGAYRNNSISGHATDASGLVDGV